MIVVIGQPGERGALAIARAAALAGGTVQLVSRVADDPAGDRLLLALADDGVGHVATLRQPPPASALEAADIELALRYLDDIGVVVATGLTASLAPIVTEAVGWSDALLLATVPDGSAVPDGLPGDAIVLEAPSTDPDGAFGSLVGSLAVRLDAGDDASSAFALAMAGAPAWTEVVDD